MMKFKYEYNNFLMMHFIFNRTDRDIHGQQEATFSCPETWISIQKGLWEPWLPWLPLTPFA